eukprot:TRINITY_DN774_c0_g1_i1.p1 TRINITY_DN774_c0_g1~~TRINITY_DN774_c0_g1_i1.p1  ORF type:complete len:788 (-),score=199.66 TRINITY_DN774_c0_g1_i1:2341-4704(-)
MDRGGRKTFKLSEVHGIVLQVGIGAASKAWVFGEEGVLLGENSCPPSPKGFTNFIRVLLRADTASIPQSEAFEVDATASLVDEVSPRPSWPGISFEAEKEKALYDVGWDTEKTISSYLSRLDRLCSSLGSQRQRVMRLMERLFGLSDTSDDEWVQMVARADDLDDIENVLRMMQERQTEFPTMGSHSSSDDGNQSVLKCIGMKFERALSVISNRRKLLFSQNGVDSYAACELLAMHLYDLLQPFGIKGSNDFFVECQEVPVTFVLPTNANDIFRRACVDAALICGFQFERVWLCDDCLCASMMEDELHSRELGSGLMFFTLHDHAVSMGLMEWKLVDQHTGKYMLYPMLLVGTCHVGVKDIVNGSASECHSMSEFFNTIQENLELVGNSDDCRRRMMEFEHGEIACSIFQTTEHVDGENEDDKDDKDDKDDDENDDRSGTNKVTVNELVDDVIEMFGFGVNERKSLNLEDIARNAFRLRSAHDRKQVIVQTLSLCDIIFQLHVQDLGKAQRGVVHQQTIANVGMHVPSCFEIDIDASYMGANIDEKSRLSGVILQRYDDGGVLPVIFVDLDFHHHWFESIKVEVVVGENGLVRVPQTQQATEGESDERCIVHHLLSPSLSACSHIRDAVKEEMKTFQISLSPSFERIKLRVPRFDLSSIVALEVNRSIPESLWEFLFLVRPSLLRCSGCGLHFKDVEDERGMVVVKLFDRSYVIHRSGSCKTDLEKIIGHVCCVCGCPLGDAPFLILRRRTNTRCPYDIIHEKCKGQKKRVSGLVTQRHTERRKSGW